MTGRPPSENRMRGNVTTLVNKNAGIIHPHAGRRRANKYWIRAVVLTAAEFRSLTCLYQKMKRENDEYIKKNPKSDWWGIYYQERVTLGLILKTPPVKGACGCKTYTFQNNQIAQWRRDAIWFMLKYKATSDMQKNALQRVLDNVVEYPRPTTDRMGYRMPVMDIATDLCPAYVN